MGHVVILPTCDDSNRGDQALVWETRRVAQQAGYDGETYMLSGSSSAPQTEATGVRLVIPILDHPQTRFKPRSNLKYGVLLLMVWGAIAVADFMRTILLLTGLGRLLARQLLSTDKAQALQVIRSADACFVKGGGFIHSTGSITDVYRAYYSLYHIFLAQSLGVPVFVMPNSYGPFEGRLFGSIVRRALVGCRLVTARESISQRSLEELGVECDLFPDLAFALNPRPLVRSPIAELRDQHPTKKIVAITVRPYRFPRARNPGKAYERYVDEIGQFARWLASQGFLPLFVEHVLSSGAHESDMTAISDVLSRIPDVEYSVLSDPELDCRDLMTIYGQCDFVLGTRFHSVIFALVEGTPAIALAYGGNKATGIMRDISFPQWVIDIHDFDSSSAIAMFETMMSDTSFHDRIGSLRVETAERRRDLIKAVQAA